MDSFERDLQLLVRAFIKYLYRKRAQKMATAHNLSKEILIKYTSIGGSPDLVVIPGTGLEVSPFTFSPNEEAFTYESKALNVKTTIPFKNIIGGVLRKTTFCLVIQEEDALPYQIDVHLWKTDFRKYLPIFGELLKEKIRIQAD